MSGKTTSVANSKIKYSIFKGRKHEDVQEWLADTKVLMKNNGGLDEAITIDNSDVLEKKKNNEALTADEEAICEKNDKALEHLQLSLKGRKMKGCLKRGDGDAFKVIEYVVSRTHHKDLKAEEVLKAKLDSIRYKGN